MAMGLWLWGYGYGAMVMGLLGYGYGSAYGKDFQTWREPSPRSRVMNLAKDVPGIRGLGEARVGVESPAKDGVEVGSGYKDTVEVESFGDGEGLQFTDIRYNQFSDRK